VVNYPKVKVLGAPGYEDFEGEGILHIPAADGRMVWIIGDVSTKEIFVINEQYVEEVA
jgi:hypothetical protein